MQQQIKEFHEMLKPILKKALEECDKHPISPKYNTVVKPCKQPIQKCSCKSVSDMRELNSLTYWLYIFEYKELALEICELVHDTDFAFEYDVDGIVDMCGLEIRITACSDRFIETELLCALYNMIGKYETGLYEHLYENRDKIEKQLLNISII